MREVLVTGGAGFIGSHLVEKLVGLGDRVICLDNFDDFYDWRVKESNLSAVLGSPLFSLVEGDIRDENLLDVVFAKNEIDTVVHLAARAGVTQSITQAWLYQDVNVHGTLTVLEACRRHNVRRFILGSSSTVYGAHARTPFREDMPIDRPASPYAVSKAAAEHLCYCYSHLYHLSTIVLRFFTVYGPRQRPDMAFHAFCRQMLAGEPITLFAEGKAKRDYTFVDDAVEGIMRAIDVECRHEVLNLGSSFVVDLRRVIEILEASLGRQAIIRYQPLRPGETLHTHADIRKAQRFLGYEPHVLADRGIPLFVDWYFGCAQSGSGIAEQAPAIHHAPIPL